MTGNSDKLFQHYLVLRSLIGSMGIGLAPTVIIWNIFTRPDGADALEKSISAYYGTPARDLFVGFLFSIGTFLFAYRNPVTADHDSSDSTLASFAGALAFGVALFPVTADNPWIKGAHVVCAVLLFILLATLALRFSRYGTTEWQSTCKRLAIAMYCLLGIGVICSMWFDDASLFGANWKLLVESALLVCFGVAWRLKGDSLQASVASLFGK